MSSPSFNPAIGTAYDQILSSHVENMQANCSINARGSFPKTDFGEDRTLDLNTMKKLLLPSMSLILQDNSVH